MTDLADIKNLNIGSSSIQLWTFRERLENKKPIFTGKWLETTDQLDDAIKSTVVDELSRITEVHDYSILAENNENSALIIDKLETYADLIISQSAEEIDKLKASSSKDIYNTKFYVVKVMIDDNILYAVSKTKSSWVTKRALGVISVFFSDHVLQLSSDNVFQISKNIDFFIFNEKIFICSKLNFESVLHYKQGHLDDFKTLQVENSFKNTFSSLDLLINHVGDNKIQLRRISAIKQKAHYKDPNFMSNLRQKASEYKLNIEFDQDGRIVPTADTCRDIIQALLDHRLASGFSGSIYDVQNTTSI